jgi:hypothetical protein
MEKYEIGTEVAFDMNCPCGEIGCDGSDQGYILHIIDGNEEKEFLERCCVFPKEIMDRLR